MRLFMLNMPQLRAKMLMKWWMIDILSSAPTMSPKDQLIRQRNGNVLLGRDSGSGLYFRWQSEYLQNWTNITKIDVKVMEIMQRFSKSSSAIFLIGRKYNLE